MGWVALFWQAYQILNEREWHMKSTLQAIVILPCAIGMLRCAMGSERPTFNTSSVPQWVYPGTVVFFPVGGADASYQLMPPVSNRWVEPIGWSASNRWSLTWWPSRLEVGTTQAMVVRATNAAGFSATNVYMVPVFEPPPIRLVSISGGVPLLEASPVRTNRVYEVLGSKDMTNWGVLWRMAVTNPVWQGVDLTATNDPWRFYRLQPYWIDDYMATDLQWP